MTLDALHFIVQGHLPRSRRPGPLVGPSSYVLCGTDLDQRGLNGVFAQLPSKPRQESAIRSAVHQRTLRGVQGEKLKGLTDDADAAQLFKAAHDAQATAAESTTLLANSERSSRVG